MNEIHNVISNECMLNENVNNILSMNELKNAKWNDVSTKCKWKCKNEWDLHGGLVSNFLTRRN